MYRKLSFTIQGFTDEMIPAIPLLGPFVLFAYRLPVELLPCPKAEKPVSCLA